MARLARCLGKTHDGAHVTTEFVMADQAMHSPTIARVAATTQSGAWIALSMTVLLASLGTSIANVGLPTLAGVFGSSVNAIQWVTSAYLVSVTASMVLAGRLGDGLGRRRLLLIGIGMFVMAALACGFADHLGVLIAARIIQGAAAALMITLPMAIIGASADGARLGRMMGLLGTSSAVGTAGGPAIGGVLIAWAGWPALFLVLVPIGLLTFGLVYRFVLRDPIHAGAADVDVRGALLLTMTLIAFSIAIAGTDGVIATRIGLMVLAIVLALAFARSQLRVPSPLVSFVHLRNRTLRSGLLLALVANAVVMATLIVGPFYLTQALMLDLRATGLVMSAGPIMAAFVGVPSGYFVDRFGANQVVIAGWALMAIGTLLLARVSIAFGIAGYAAPLVVLTAGFATFMAATNTIVMRSAPDDQRGVVAGLLSLSRYLGLAMGAALASAVFAIVVRREGMSAGIPELVTAGVQQVFGLAAVLLGAIAVSGLRRAFCPSTPGG